jgi:colicin import membrane protein
MIAEATSRTQVRIRWDRRRWYPMLGCSLILHGALVVVGMLWSGVFAAQSSIAPVYSVELVSLPTPAGKKVQTFHPTSRRERVVVQGQSIPIRRFQAKEGELTLRKLKGPVPPSEKQDEAKILEKSLAKLERRPPPPAAPSSAVEASRSEPRQSEGIKKNISLINIGSMKGDELSQALGLYRALVYDKIESNWVLPERFIPEKAQMEAVVVVRARRDGTLTDIHFEKKSGDPYFDDSVLKAILKSKPFPPFPDIYSPKEEEIVIRFSPVDGRA